MKKAIGVSLWIAAVLFLGVFLSANAARAATNWTVVGWNNLGMHCLDDDFSVFSLLPPYNTIMAQVIDPNGLLVTNSAGLTVTYQAVADPTGSINTTSAGKANFWDNVHALFGLLLPVDVGLPVPGPSFAMPGTNNVPQAMMFETNANWFAAYGIPLTPYDDARVKNPYPLMRLVAQSGGATLASLDIVLPLSDEMSCKSCHGSGSNPAAQPAAGWVNVTNSVSRDYRLNVLRLHDDRQGTNLNYQADLLAVGYNTNGLYATVTINATAILCARCHLSEALPGSGYGTIPPLTQSMHGKHATVLDPTNGQPLEAIANRSACYQCHPGSLTRCLRGVMGNSVAANGQLAIQCQNCHGTMTTVAATTRIGWLNEPNCQACHSGTAVANSGQIRFTSAFATNGQLRVPADPTFATTPDAPAAGLSLYRFSRGHGGLYCEACHGSTHAEFPSSHHNDNIQSIQHQGHTGVLAECGACHPAAPATVSGGPHGLHPLGQPWVSQHSDIIESSGAAQCQVCHGADYRGTVLSRSQADRVITAFGTKTFWRGFQIGCYTCHNGPGSDSANPNHPPAVTSLSTATGVNVPLAIPLTATDADHDPLTLRIVAQTQHGRVGLVGTAATYYPDTDYVGGDSFTFAASDGQTDSNLGLVQISVGAPGCLFAITPTGTNATAFGGANSLTVTAGSGCAWSATNNVSWLTITAGASGSGNGTVKFAVAPNPSTAARQGTLTVAGQTFSVTQAASTADVTGSWISLVSTCRTSSKGVKCSLRGQFVVQNVGSLAVPVTVLAIYLSNDSVLDGADTLLKSYNTTKLAVGKSAKRRVSITLPTGVAASGKYIIALVDADDAVPDIDDTNNIIPFGPLP